MKGIDNVIVGSRKLPACCYVNDPQEDKIRRDTIESWKRAPNKNKNRSIRSKVYYDIKDHEVAALYVSEVNRKRFWSGLRGQTRMYGLDDYDESGDIMEVRDEHNGRSFYGL